MSTTKKNTTTKKSLSSDKLIALYMDYVLENEKTPKSVYRFCKDNKLKEDEFYNFFGSFESLQKGIWERFFEHTLKVLETSPEYHEFTNREKMLTFYYTFFEMLSANRSFVLFSLRQYESKLKNLEQLKGLRKQVKHFAQELINEENETKNLKVLKQSEAIFSEAAWIQLMFLLNFWMDDNSAKFESTDVAIEKSVNTVFDVFDNIPLERVIDFGKFLWKEKMA
ncbi:MAG: TetR family transcriptional regulator C-terminal domain-containing protein [Salegentibacter sp.]|uniref:DNA-binding transcriptional regulator, AcrR family n=1 Tax=Salegentibacter flavus TaxID=287099 RepID=A0A1I4Y9A2_9FLAO|nr:MULTISPECIES: TetR family transcriptional regulator C-terminal domain-containing protein [Salegentibacter]MDR9456905.1 TetR family transcriptional regulator C-terminal domain-containing protein [Salegentibacter sp.]SFN34333.1 DNA-binding transcriptional regulator, AcrR family [Salegentibacter flavus]